MAAQQGTEHALAQAEVVPFLPPPSLCATTSEKPAKQVWEPAFRRWGDSTER